MREVSTLFFDNKIDWTLKRSNAMNNLTSTNMRMGRTIHKKTVTE